MAQAKQDNKALIIAMVIIMVCIASIVYMKFVREQQQPASDILFETQRDIEAREAALAERERAASEWHADSRQKVDYAELEFNEVNFEKPETAGLVVRDRDGNKKLVRHNDISHTRKMTVDGNRVYRIYLGDGSTITLSESKMESLLENEKLPKAYRYRFDYNSTKNAPIKKKEED